MAPWADYLYACDGKWWQHHWPIEFAGEMWTQASEVHKDQFKVVEEFGLQYIEGRHEKGLGDPFIHYGSNSGYQAINLAYLFGAGQIILLGYDMQETGGKAHWFGDHPKGLVNGNYSGLVGHFTRLASDLAARGVDVVNCTRETALTCFRRVPLEEVLAA